MTGPRDQADRLIPGEVRPGPDPVVVNAGRRAVTVRVLNTSRWPVHVSSHYHFFEANRRLRFDRAAAFGMHLLTKAAFRYNTASPAVRVDPASLDVTVDGRLVEIPPAESLPLTGRYLIA